jgi:NTP pyrophosphatase (non-canonical NTP hydrolase)
MLDNQVIAELTRDCYEASKKGGWHNDLETGEPRNLTQNWQMFLTRITLAHSELSEAMEGHRKSQMDDKLPHLPMVQVEIADAVIRVHDLAGCMGLRLEDATIRDFTITMDSPFSVPNHLARLHAFLSEATNIYDDRGDVDLKEELQFRLRGFTEYAFALANSMQFDLMDVIWQKMTFNASRADHKAGARKAAGGKAY